jgi:hypothetical protein
MMKQACNRVFMVRPAAFGFNPETAETNAFQQTDLADDNFCEKALEEFDLLVYQLKQEGIDVLVYQDTQLPEKPDAVFPNNWIGMHDQGIRVYYPMLAKNRRLERSPEVISFLDTHLPAIQVRDYSEFELQDLAMEGTGSLIFDHLNKRVFASISPRTQPKIMLRIVNDLGYEPILFDAFDANGHAYYHTNVILSIGTKYALVCAEAIPESEREKVLESLKYPGRTIIPINRQQVNAFAGNVLEVSNSDDETLIVISRTAIDSLHDEQIAVLQRSGLLLIAEIPVIEKVGGGSVRCMLAEIRE